jgi:transmembrane sensor
MPLFVIFSMTAKMEINTDIYDIIIRSFSGNINEQEKYELESWKSASKDNLLEYLDYEYIWGEVGRLSKMPKINLADVLKSTFRKAGIGKRNLTIFWKQAAAVLVLSVLFSGLYNYYIKAEPEVISSDVVYQEVKATYGTQTRMELADGTIVHLNSGSTLTFPSSFHGSEIRKVHLSGEGYFLVNEKKQQPFVVDVDKMQVLVTGTSFNVEAYPGNSSIKVALVEGEVILQRETNRGMDEMTVMEPGEVAALNLSENRLYLGAQQNINKFYAWTEGKIVFIDDPIQVVVEKLSNWYNVDIEISDKQLERYRFTGTFIDEPVEQLLDILSRTSPMGYTIVPSRKMEDNTFTRRKIILRPK